MKQELLWMPRGDTPHGAVAFSGDERILRVWTLFLCTNEAEPPTLPFDPVHRQNAFLEDHIHDWIIRGSTFRYYSRAVNLQESGVWLLLEYKDE